MLFPDPGSQILTTGSRIYIGTNLKVTLLCSFLDGENGMDSVFLNVQTVFYQLPIDLDFRVPESA